MNAEPSYFLQAPPDPTREAREQLMDIRRAMHSTDPDEIQRALASVVALRNQTRAACDEARWAEDTAKAIREEAESIHNSVCQTLNAMLGAEQ